MTAPERRCPRHRAVTLVELLVVVAVLAILLGAVLHMMQPMMKEMKVREAARMVNSFLAGAQARASELGRPVAVLIEPYVRKNSDGTFSATGAAYQMFIAETPPPFAGDTMSAKATIDEQTRSQATLSSASMLANYQDEELVGGFIRFGFRGHFYEIESVSDSGVVVFLTKDSSGLEASHPANFQHPPAPGKIEYQVFPRPIKTSVTPLDIPEPLAIDIEKSGFYEKDFQKFEVIKTLGTDSAAPPFIISFAPTGIVDRVYGKAAEEDHEVHHPTGAVHLLIGWADKVGVADPKEGNEGDFTTRWVSVSHATGRIITAENAGNDEGTNPREFAEQGLAMGDRN